MGAENGFVYLRGIRINGAPQPGSCLSELPMVKQLVQRGEIAFSSPATFLVGENGSGKFAPAD